MEQHKRAEDEAIREINREIAKIKDCLNETVIRLKVFSSNDKQKMEILEEDYLTLLAEIAVANKKLDFIEVKINEKIIDIRNDVNKTLTSTSALKTAIRDIIKIVMKNKKSISTISTEKIAVNKLSSDEIMDSEKSLKDNLYAITNAISENSKNIASINSKLDILLDEYNKMAIYRRAMAFVYNKLRLLFNTTIKHVVKSIIIRLMLLISAVIGLSPKFVEIVERIKILILGE